MAEKKTWPTVMTTATITELQQVQPEVDGRAGAALGLRLLDRADRPSTRLKAPR